MLLPCSSSPMTPHHIWTEIQIPLISSQGFYRTCLSLLLGLNCNNSFLPTLLQPHCRPCVYAKHEQGSTARPLYLQLSLAGMFFPHIFIWPFLIPLQTLLKCYFSQRPLSPPRLKNSPLILTHSCPITVCFFILLLFIALNNTSDHICLFFLSCLLSHLLGSCNLIFFAVIIYSTQDVSGTQQVVNKCFFFFFNA